MEGKKRRSKGGILAAGAAVGVAYVLLRAPSVPLRRTDKSIDINGEVHADLDRQGRGLTPVLIFLLFFTALATAGGVGLVQTHGAAILKDYFAYLLPVAAGIVAGLIIYYPKTPKRWFWLSGIFLIFGLLSYIATQGISVKIIAAADVIFSAVFVAGLIYDESVYRKVRKSRVDKFSRAFLPVALGFLTFASAYYIWQAARTQPPGCQIMLARPTRASIVIPHENTVSPNRTSSGISSERWDLGEVSSIVISECPKPRERGDLR